MKNIIILILSIFIVSSCTNNWNIDNTELWTWELEEVSLWVIDEENFDDVEYISVLWWDEEDTSSVIPSLLFDITDFNKKFEDGKYDELEKELLELNKSDFNVSLWLMTIYMETQEYKKALEYWLKANAMLRWKDSELLFKIWFIYWALWDIENWIKYAKLWLKINPDNISAKELLLNLEEKE